MDTYALAAWAALGVVFLGMEAFGLWRRSDGFPTLSEILRRLPRPVLASGIGALAFWLFEHLVVNHP